MNTTHKSSTRDLEILHAEIIGGSQEEPPRFSAEGRRYRKWKKNHDKQAQRISRLSMSSPMVRLKTVGLLEKDRVIPPLSLGLRNGRLRPTWPVVLTLMSLVPHHLLLARH